MALATQIVPCGAQNLGGGYTGVSDSWSVRGVKPGRTYRVRLRGSVGGTDFGISYNGSTCNLACDAWHANPEWDTVAPAGTIRLVTAGRNNGGNTSFTDYEVQDTSSDGGIATVAVWTGLATGAVTIAPTAGDVLVATVLMREQGGDSTGVFASATAPTGWVAASAQHGFDASLIVGAQMRTFVKVATGSETSFTPAGSGFASPDSVIIRAYRGAVGAAVLQVDVDGNNGDDSISGTAPTGAALAVTTFAWGSSSPWLDASSSGPWDNDYWYTDGQTGFGAGQRQAFPSGAYSATLRTSGGSVGWASEVLFLAEPAARVSQLPVEAVLQPTDAQARTSQLPVEVVLQPTSARARTSQLVVEALIQNLPTQDVSVALLSQAAATFSPTITTGAVSAALGLIDRTAQTFAPTISVQQFVSVALVDRSAATFSPTTSNLNAFTPALVNQAAQTSAPTVTATATISLALLDRTATASAPTLTQPSTQAITFDRIVRTAETFTPVYNSQFLRPQSDVTNTGTNGFAAIDETTASDVDFWWGDNNVAETLEVALTDPSFDPLSSTGHVVRYRIAKTNAGVLDGGGNAVTVTASLFQGATLVRADTAKTATGTWTSYSFTLTGGEADAITNYNDLRLRFVTSVSGGGAAARRGGAVSWAEMEIPTVTPQGVILATTDRTASPFAPTVSLAASAVTVGLISQAAAVHAPAVSATASVVLDLLDRTATSSTPAVSATAAINLALIDATAVALDPSVSAAAGDQAITVALVDQTAVAFAPTASSAAAVVLALVDQTAAAHAPSVASTATVALGLIDQSAAPFAPVVSSTQEILLALLDRAAVAHAPTASSGGQDVVLGLVDRTASPFAPTISSTRAVVLARIAQTAATFSPVVALSLSVVTVGRIDQTATPFEPTSVVLQIIPGSGTIDPEGYDGSSGSGAYYIGNAKAVHTRPETFSVEPAGPPILDPTYVGRSQAVLQDDRSPHQWDIDSLMGPFFDAVYYKGRSQAIHVFGEDLEEFPPVDPIPACKCCEEQGGCSDCGYVSGIFGPPEDEDSWPTPWEPGAGNAGVAYTYEWDDDFWVGEMMVDFGANKSASQSYPGVALCASSGTPLVASTFFYGNRDESDVTALGGLATNTIVACSLSVLQFTTAPEYSASAALVYRRGSGIGDGTNPVTQIQFARFSGGGSTLEYVDCPLEVEAGRWNQLILEVTPGQPLRARIGAEGGTQAWVTSTLNAPSETTYDELNVGMKSRSGTSQQQFLTVKGLLAHGGGSDVASFDCAFEDWTDNQGTPMAITADAPSSLGGPSATDWVMNTGAAAGVSLVGNTITQAALSPVQHNFTARFNASTAPTEFALLKDQQTFRLWFSMTEPAPQQNSVCSVTFDVAWLGSPSGDAEVLLSVSYSSITGLYTTTLRLLANGGTTTTSRTGSSIADGGMHAINLTIGGFFWLAECDGLSVLDSTEAGSPFNATTYVELFADMSNRSGFNFGATPTFETLRVGVIELPDSGACDYEIVACDGDPEHAQGDCADEPCEASEAVLLATQSFANRAWSGRVIHQHGQSFHAVTGAMTNDIEQHARAITSLAEGSYEGRAGPHFQHESFGRDFVRHTAPTGATHAILRLRMYAESQIADQAEMTEAGGVLPTPWEIWTWDPSVEWSSNDTSVDTSPPTYAFTSAAAATAYNSLVTLIASGSLVTDGADGSEALLSNDNDQVAVAVPIVDGEVLFAFVVPESIGSINGTYLHNPGEPDEDQYGVTVPRFPDLRDLVEFTLVTDVDDSIWGLVTARPAQAAVNGFTSQRYALEFYDSDPSGGVAPCLGCDECEDPSNPGFPIPPFLPGYLPIFRPQIGDPTTSLDSFICTLESGAMALDWHTRGAVQVWGGELIPWTGRSEASIAGSGANLGNVKQAWLHYGQNLENWSGGSWGDVQTAINQGRAVILQGDYGEFSLGERCQDSFEGGHAVVVLPYLSSDRLLVGDPLCGNFKGFKVSSLQAYAESLGAAVFGATSPQRILFAVTRPWTP